MSAAPPCSYSENEDMVRPKQIAQDGASDGEVLTWNNSTQKWEPQTPSGGGGGAGGTYESLFTYNFTTAATTDYKAGGDGTYPLTGSVNIDVVNSSALGASGEAALDGAGGTGRGLVVAVNGDNSSTSGTSGTAFEYRIGLQQIDADLNPTWPMRVLIEYTLAGTTSDNIAGLYIDNDPSLRGSGINGYNSSGMQIPLTGTLEINKWESGSFLTSGSEQTRPLTTDRQFAGLSWEGMGLVSVWQNRVVGGTVGSTFPSWAALKSHGMLRVSERGRGFWSADTWALRILFGGLGGTRTLEWNIKSLRIQAVRRD